MFNNLIYAAGATAIRMRPMPALCVMQQIIDNHVEYTLAKRRLIGSAICTTLVVTQYHEPPFLEKRAQNTALALNIYVGLLVFMLLCTQYCRTLDPDAVGCAREWFYDAPQDLLKRLRDQASVWAVRLHGFLIMQPVSAFVLSVWWCKSFWAARWGLLSWSVVDAIIWALGEGWEMHQQRQIWDDLADVVAKRRKA